MYFRGSQVATLLHVIAWCCHITHARTVPQDPRFYQQYAMFNQFSGNDNGEFDDWMETPGMQQGQPQQDDQVIDDWVNQYQSITSDPEYEAYYSQWSDYYNQQGYGYGDSSADTEPLYWPAEDGAEIDNALDLEQLQPSLRARPESENNIEDSININPLLIDHNDVLSGPSIFQRENYNQQNDNNAQQPSNYAQQSVNNAQQPSYVAQQSINNAQQSINNAEQPSNYPQSASDGQQASDYYNYVQQYYQNNPMEQSAGNDQVVYDQYANNPLVQLYNHYANYYQNQQGTSEDGMSSALPSYYMGQNAWYGQTVGQNQVWKGYNMQNATTEHVKYINHKDSFPNKKPSAGIPNKVIKEEIVLDNLGFLLDESPVLLPPEECITEDEEVGQCMSAYQCGMQNGELNGLCHQGLDNSAHLRSCCIFPSFCGFESNKEVVYFKSPEYPETSPVAAECIFRVNLLPNVCQVRVDFIDFETKDKNSDGMCDAKHKLHISSAFMRAFIPVNTFCGSIKKEEHPARTDLRHIYIHFDDLPLDSNFSEPVHHKRPYVDFKMISLNHTARWNLRISQINCDGAPLQAPSGCSQYYNSHNATMKDLEIGQLKGDGKLSACVRTDTTACAVKYKIKDMQIGDKTKMGYGLTCQNYIGINGMKSGVCGHTQDKEIILPISGPQAVNYIYEEGESSERDRYSIEYSYINNCKNTNFYKYPSAK